MILVLGFLGVEIVNGALYSSYNLMISIKLRNTLKEKGTEVERERESLQ
jgi:hypothetical protein